MCDPFRYPSEESKAKVNDFEMEYGKSSQVSSKSCDLACFYLCKLSGKLLKFFVYFCGLACVLVTLWLMPPIL